MKRLLVFALIVAALGGAAAWVARPPAPRVTVVNFAALPHAEQGKRRIAAQSAVRRIEAITRRVRHKDKRAFTLSLSQDELNTLLQDRLRAQNLPFKNARVGLQGGLLILEADASYKGLAAPVSLAGKLAARGGGVAFTLDSLSLGGLFPAPASWKAKVQRAVDDGLKHALKDKGAARVESVEVGDGTLDIQGRTG